MIENLILPVRCTVEVDVDAAARSYATYVADQRWYMQNGESGYYEMTEDGEKLTYGGQPEPWPMALQGHVIGTIGELEMHAIITDYDGWACPVLPWEPFLEQMEEERKLSEQSEAAG